jgi:hypothetical protein
MGTYARVAALHRSIKTSFSTFEYDGFNFRANFERSSIMDGSVKLLCMWVVLT